MCFVFLMVLICFGTVSSSNLEPLNTENDELNLIVDKKVPKYFLKKIDPAIKNKDCDLRYKDIKIIDNTIYQEKDIVQDIYYNLIHQKSEDMRIGRKMGTFLSAISGVLSALGCILYSALSISSPIFSSPLVLRNFLISGVQSILNFTGTVYFLKNSYNQKKENIHEFIKHIFNDKKFENQQCLKKEQVEEMCQKIIETVRREYETVDQKKELLYKILPILHSTLSLGGSVFILLNTAAKEDAVAWSTQIFNGLFSLATLVSYTSGLLGCDKQPSACIGDIEIELRALLEKYQNETLIENI